MHEQQRTRTCQGGRRWRTAYSLRLYGGLRPFDLADSLDTELRTLLFSSATPVAASSSEAEIWRPCGHTPLSSRDREQTKDHVSQANDPEGTQVRTTVQSVKLLCTHLHDLMSRAQRIPPQFQRQLSSQFSIVDQIQF